MHPVSFFRRTAAAIGLTFAAACGSTEPKVPAKDVVPTAITGTTSGTLSGTAGLVLATPITVIVTNKSGQPIDSATVTFAAATGGGSVGAASVRTNAQGQASTTWTLGSTVGAQTATATVAGLAPVTFTATAAAAPAAAVAKVAGDNQTAVAGTNVATVPAVRVNDQFGNPVAGVFVSFAVATGGGLVTGGAVNTAADGTARPTAWRLGNTVGANTVTATVGSLPVVTFTATAVAGAVASIVFTNTAPSLVVGQTFTLTTQARDASNNVVTPSGVVYSSGNVAAITVNASTGVLTAVGAGSSLISATVGAVSATQVVTVVGAPGGTLAANVAAGSRIAGVAIVSSTVWYGKSSGTTLGTFSLSGVTNTTVPADVPVDAQPRDVAMTKDGSLLTTITAGSQPLLVLLNPSTRAKIDSVILPVAPSKMAMTSTGDRAVVALSDFRVAAVDIASRTITAIVNAPGTAVKMKMVGDTSVYMGTVLGRIYEINAATGAVKRTIDINATLVDFDISPDGKTLFYATAGGSVVTYLSLAPGGLAGTVDFGNTVNGVAMTPDGSELWAAMPGKVIAAPYTGGIFQTTIFNKQYLLATTNPTRIYFAPSGDTAVVTDEVANSFLILR